MIDKCTINFNEISDQISLGDVGIVEGIFERAEEFLAKGGKVVVIEKNFEDTPPQEIRRIHNIEQLKEVRDNFIAIKCLPIKKQGDYEAVVFTKYEKTLLELRVSGPAIVSNLNNVDIHKWLCETGRKFISEIENSITLLIKSADVADKKLVTGWKNLLQVID